MQEWKPVDTCPENKVVIIFAPEGKNQTKNLVTQCFHFSKGNFSYGDYSSSIDGVTHWMPLPEAPHYDSPSGSYECIGVIDSEGGIYPEPPEAGTQIFVETPNAALRGDSGLIAGVPLESTVMQKTEE